MNSRQAADKFRIENRTPLGEPPVAILARALLSPGNVPMPATSWQADITLDVDDDPIEVCAVWPGKRVYIEGFTILTGANAWSAEPSGVEFLNEDATIASVAAASLTANAIINHYKAAGITFFTPWVEGSTKSVKVAPSPVGAGAATALKIRVWGKIK